MARNIISYEGALKVETNSLLNLALNSLKKRLRDNQNLIEIYKGKGMVKKVTCHFNDSLNEDDLDTFMAQYDLVLPFDYSNFLLIHNGAKLFFDPYYGGEFEFYDIDTMVYILEGRPDNWLIIGMHYGHELVINMEYVIEGRMDYLFYRDACETEGVIHPLGVNFELFFERSIICQGHGFWDWNMFTVENYYRANGFL